jgi:hypothetical protein
MSNHWLNERKRKKVRIGSLPKSGLSSRLPHSICGQQERTIAMDYLRDREYAKRMIEEVYSTQKTQKGKYLELLKMAFYASSQICLSAIDNRPLRVEELLLLEQAKTAMHANDFENLNFADWPQHAGMTFLRFARRSARELMGAFVAAVGGIVFKVDKKYVMDRLVEGEKVGEKEIQAFLTKVFGAIQKEFNLTNADYFNRDCEALVDKFLAETDMHRHRRAVKEAAESQCRHSDDFASVIWYGKKYTFTKMQAAAIKVLWENWENKTPEVSEKTIGENAGSVSNNYRIATTFYKHPALNTMIHACNKRGIFKLDKPRSNHKKNLKKK